MGIIIALLNAASVSALNVFLKKLDTLSPNVLTFVRTAAAMPVLALLVTFFVGWSVPVLPFWLLVTLILVPLEVVLAYVGTKALHLSPISVIAPIGAFTSIFLLPVGYIVLGELPTQLGLVGVFLIVIGSFFLGAKWGELNANPLMLFKDRGVQLALFGTFIASIVITVTKLSFEYASPILAAFYKEGLLTLVLIPVFLIHIQALRRAPVKHVSGLGLMSGIGITLHNIGLSLLPAVYYVSIKRLSLIFNVLTGKTLFNETNTLLRLAGSALMVGGVILIALG